MQPAKRRRWTLARILAGTLGGAVVGGPIGMSTGDAVLIWVWLSVAAALGAVIAAAPAIADEPPAAHHERGHDQPGL